MVEGSRGGGGRVDIFGRLWVSFCPRSCDQTPTYTDEKEGMVSTLLRRGYSPESSLKFRSVLRYPSISRLTWWKSGRMKSAARPSSGSEGMIVAAAMFYDTRVSYIMEQGRR